MILFCDEDIGTGVPSALTLVDYNAKSLMGLSMGGQGDTDWLPRVGNRGWLVFSSNKRMLLVESEREAIIQNRVGIVYLTNGEENTARVLWLLLVKWKWLEEIDQNTPKPFAYFISPTGRISRSYNYRGRQLSL